MSADPLRAAIFARQTEDRRRAFLKLGITPPDDDPDDDAPPKPPRVNAGTGTRTEPATKPSTFDAIIRSLLGR
jgi:hypothetical protein